MMTTNDACPECGKHYITYDAEHAQRICSACGIVLEENVIDLGPDWRNFEGEGDKAHAEPTSNLRSDNGLGTTFSTRYSGKGSSSMRMYRLKQLQRRIQRDCAGKRSLATAMESIRKIGQDLDLCESMQKLVASDYKTFAMKNGLRGRSVRTCVAAITYAVCRKSGYSRSLDEISKATDIPRRDLGRAYRFISRMMRYKIEVSSPIEYVDRFGSRLGLSVGTIQYAKNIIRGITDQFIGKSPVSVAATALYMASERCGEHRTQKKVADVCGVTEVTIRKLSKIMVGIIKDEPDSKTVTAIAKV